MGKARKSRKHGASRTQPYPARASTGDLLDEPMAMDVQTAETHELDAEYPASLVGGESVAPSTSSLAVEDGSATESAAPPSRTRGAILQRHKREKKALRSKVDELRKERLRFSKKSNGQRDHRKDLTREIKALTAELEQRHIQEIKDFEEQSTPAILSAGESVKDSSSVSSR